MGRLENQAHKQESKKDLQVLQKSDDVQCLTKKPPLLNAENQLRQTWHLGVLRATASLE